MKNLLVILTLFSLTFFACGKRESRPVGILSRKDMVNALSEIYVSEEKVKHLSISHDSALKVFSSMRGQIFEGLDMSDSTFKKSFDYYWSRPEEMEEIYTALIDTLNLREQRRSIENHP